MASQPQTTWIQDENGEDIIDFVGQVENLDADLCAVAARVGLPKVALGRKNSSAARPGLRHVPTEEDYHFIAEAHKADFDRFGYDPTFRIPVA